MHKFLFYNKFITCLYMFRALCAHHQEVKIVLYSIWYHHTCRWSSREQVERGLVHLVGFTIEMYQNDSFHRRISFVLRVPSWRYSYWIIRTAPLFRAIKAFHSPSSEIIKVKNFAITICSLFPGLDLITGNKVLYNIIYKMNCQPFLLSITLNSQRLYRRGCNYR